MNYIITASNNNYLGYLFEFLVSLDLYGKFLGKIIIHYYYRNKNDANETEKSLSIFSNIDIVMHDEALSHHMCNNVYIDSYDFVKNLSSDDKIAIYDCDIWFQDDINELFSINSFVCSVERLFDRDLKRVLDYSLKIKSKFCFIDNKDFYLDKILEIGKKYGDHINSGLIYGPKDIILEKLNFMSYIYNNENTKNERGVDQLAVNIAFDLEKDDASFYSYNYCLLGKNIENLLLHDDGFFYLKNERIKALHFNDKKTYYEKMRFYNFHSEELSKYLNKCL